MNTLRKWIYNSAIYNFILAFCRLAEKSFFFKPTVYATYNEKQEIYQHTAIYKSLSFIGKFFEKFFAKLRLAWESSIIVGFLKDLMGTIAKNTLIGKMIKQFNIVYLIPFYVYIDFFTRKYIPSVSSIWDELLFVVMVLWIIARRILRNKKYRFTSLDLPIVLFAMVYLFLLFVNSPELDVAIEGYRAVVQYIFWFFIVVQLIDTKEVAYRMVWAFIIAIGLLGLHGMYQYFTHAPMLGNWVDSGETITTRAYSIIKSPNALGSVLVLNIPVALSMFIAEKDILKKILAILFTSFMGFGLLFTFTRGAWVVGFFAVILLFIFVSRRLIIVIATMATAALIYINALWSRASYLFTPEYQAKAARGGRTYRWAAALTEWSESKAIGLGLGRYGGAVAMNHKLSQFYVDNYYVKTIAEVGLIGLISLLLLIIITIRQVYLYIKNTKDITVRILMYGMFSGILAVVGHNFVENIFESPFMVTYFWSYVAIIIAMNKIDCSKEA
ncbi:MAG: hypothetical protein CVV02_17470 [Firmicutes bacterium HGW-Firmicutes-7]|nr:MAG: hypothetical protein CVV02_17470 [Firmicutes bacterium HGW-Firmicutes-7]